MKMSLPQKKTLAPVLVYLAAGLVMVFLSYSLPRLLPGDFVTAMYANSHVTLNQQQEAELKAYYTQRPSFPAYLGRLLSLDWGYSYAFLTPVSSLILEALPWTLLLLGSAHLLSMFLGFVAGVEAAWRRGSRVEKAGVGSMTVLEGVPEIGSGVILLLVFALYLGWFPAAGAETVYAQQSAGRHLADIAMHLALPLATLIIAYFPGNFLLARGSLVLVLKSDFIRTARAKGLPPPEGPLRPRRPERHAAHGHPVRAADRLYDNRGPGGGDDPLLPRPGNPVVQRHLHAGPAPDPGDRPLLLAADAGRQSGAGVRLRFSGSEAEACVLI